MDGRDECVLRVLELCVVYPSKVRSMVISNVSFDVRSGSVVCILGESGSGKTTILKAISGMAPVSYGSVEIDQQRRSGKPAISFLQYDAPLLPFRTLFQNACLGVELAGIDRGNVYQKTISLLETLRLIDHAASLPAAISGGMRQRLAFVQSVVVSPIVLLLDEPFAFQDRSNQAAMEEVIFQEVRNGLGIGCLLVTHDLEAAAALADEVLVLAGGPGRLNASLKCPERFKNLSPADRRTHGEFDEWADAVWHEVRHARQT